LGAYAFAPAENDLNLKLRRYRKAKEDSQADILVGYIHFYFCGSRVFHRLGLGYYLALEERYLRLGRCVWSDCWTYLEFEEP
jgi:hypothetical protein